jgi:hypothetical protein
MQGSRQSPNEHTAVRQPLQPGRQAVSRRPALLPAARPPADAPEGSTTGVLRCCSHSEKYSERSSASAASCATASSICCAQAAAASPCLPSASSCKEEEGKCEMGGEVGGSGECETYALKYRLYLRISRSATLHCNQHLSYTNTHARIAAIRTLRTSREKALLV